ncbi:sialidase family protein [Niabella beijingensis]|uniref:sialidase family protein n=1 Tax=Niabella beijingensis TaxID=2872700 RepID=UPI001CBAAEFA|nr:sialidase family protein [Niabella beijingensis]MBZ4191391.1 glycoside hydrolase [Niabella beijingensis]
MIRFSFNKPGQGIIAGRQIAATAMVFCILLSACSSGKRSASSTGALHDIVLKLPPGQDNPRNSEGSFVTLKDGRILFVYSRYTGINSGDHAPAYLAGRYSSDGGKTWTAQDVKIVDREGGMNVMSVSLLRLKNGTIALFYLRKNSTVDCIPVVRFSDDEAKTWSAPVDCITDQQGYFVLNNDRVIQLADGRLMLAVAKHSSPSDSKWLEKGALFAYYSDDNGRTWTAGQQVPTPAGIITQEPGLVALKDGRVMMYIRASGGSQYVSYSKDRGAGWSTAVPFNLKSPVSPATIERIPSTGDLLAVWNNNDGSVAAIKGKRTPLTVAVSKDDGKSWIHIKNLEADPDGWYCYTAIHFYKKNVLLAYCAGSQKTKTHLSVTDISRFPLTDLYKF